MDAISDILGRQCGVISRRQVVTAEADDLLIARKVRGRHWSRVHPGVYVDHTGPPTWHQRAWAALLYAAPAGDRHGPQLRSGLFFGVMRGKISAAGA